MGVELSVGTGLGLENTQYLNHNYYQSYQLFPEEMLSDILEQDYCLCLSGKQCGIKGFSELIYINEYILKEMKVVFETISVCLQLNS